MKRRLLTIAVFLLLGAVVNVAVAWGSALCVNVSEGARDIVDEWDFSKEYGGFIASRWRRASAERVSVVYYSFRDGSPGVNKYEVEDLIPKWGLRCLLDVPAASQYAPLNDDDFRTIDARGWPFLGLWGGVQEPNPNTTFGPRAPSRTYYALVWNDGQPLTNRMAAERHVVLPLRPIWPGFASNTIFYAALLWLLIGALFVLRRFLRLKRGLCPKCAYPVGESPICSECGCGLAKRASTT